jgi:hypothetical protein
VLTGNHWDDVIQQYKELEMSNYKAPAEVAAAIKGVEKRIESVLAKPISFLPPHVIELSQDGWIGTLERKCKTTKYCPTVRAHS